MRQACEKVIRKREAAQAELEALCEYVDHLILCEEALRETEQRIEGGEFKYDSDRAATQTGFYIRTNLGLAVALGLTNIGRDNDGGTRCDKLSNPGLAETRPDECMTASLLVQWMHEVVRGNGVQSVLSVGYVWNSLPIEEEFLCRTTTYRRGKGDAQIIDEVTLEKQQQELEIVDGGLEDLMAQSVFANAYYKCRMNSHYTPYFGVGVSL